MIFENKYLCLKKLIKIFNLQNFIKIYKHYFNKKIHYL